SALLTWAKPAARARAAVASPTARRGKCRWLCGKAAIALTLAARIAWTLPAGGKVARTPLMASMDEMTGRKPNSATRAAVSLAPGSGRVIRTPAPASGKDVARAVGPQAGAELA